MNKPKNFLIAPLNWGLGHATRCIPIIEELLKKNQAVFIASDGRALELLKKEFPHLTFFTLPSYPIIYPKENESMFVKMLLSFPSLLRTIFKEHHEIKKICSENKIDVIISDNRYGARTDKIKSIFITHQINIKVPKNLIRVEKMINKMNHFFISKFDECWIPDREDSPNLSGALSHPCQLKIPFKYIGPLSRFANKLLKKNEIYDLLVLLSGPEPQRTILEKKVVEQSLQLNKKILIVRGITELKEEKKLNENITIINYLTSQELLQSLSVSKMVLSRSGYSGIMDLAALNKKAIFIPTPGQTEQEYLAEYFSNKNIFYHQKQNELNLQLALAESKSYTGIDMQDDFTGYVTAIDSLI